MQRGETKHGTSPSCRNAVRRVATGIIQPAYIVPKWCCRSGNQDKLGVMHCHSMDAFLRMTRKLTIAHAKVSIGRSMHACACMAHQCDEGCDSVCQQAGGHTSCTTEMLCFQCLPHGSVDHGLCSLLTHVMSWVLQASGGGPCASSTACS